MKRIIFVAIVLIAAGLSGCTSKIDTFATLYGVVSNNVTGEPVGSVSVALTPGGKTKTTGTDGYYEFNDLDAGLYTITVGKTGYQTNSKPATAVSGEKTETNISITKK
jgi:hypothetical protein